MTGKIVHYAEVKSRDTVRYEHTYEGSVLKGISVEIVVGKKASIFKDHQLVKTFVLGDWAEYHSYNFAYHGKITAISAKTITVQPYPDSDPLPSAKRMSLYDFCWRNWDLDLDAAAEQFSNWLYTS